jgi:hypothetical protein
VGKLTGKKPLWKASRRWEDQIHFKETELIGGYFHLAQDRGKWWPLVNAVMNLQVHKMRGIS